jgi:glycosyltransferase involved in cell wall biosynthesis
MFVESKGSDAAALEPIRVLHVIDTLAIGGAERVLVELVNCFDKRVIHPFVCITRKSDEHTFLSELQNDIKVFQLQRRVRWDIGALKQFGRIIKENEIQIIHAHGYGSARFSVAANLLNAIRTPIVVHAHNSTRPSAADRFVVRCGSEHFIANSPQLVEWSKSLFRIQPDAVSLVENAIDTKRYDQAQPTKIWSNGRPRPKFVGIVIANVNPIKDLESLFRGVAMSRHKEDLQILIAGSLNNTKYVASCHALLSELQMGDRVTFLGTRCDIPELLASTDFGLLSSTSETGPIALLEYMAAGLPFVSTRVGQVGSAVSRWLPQSFVPPKDHIAFGKALGNLLDLSASERRKYGSIGRQLLEEHFTLRHSVLRLTKIYRRLVDKTRGKHEKQSLLCIEA